MIPNPIHKVLSILSTRGVRALLMGGQACVLYGAAEFSRDTDVVILAEPDNLDRLRQAVRRLDAEVIAVPPFELQYLQRGHAIHFRCRHPEVAGMRLDVMAVLRGLPGFAELWRRRTTLTVDDGDIETLSLPDLIRAKKTQRDKDWPMIRRLVEADYAAAGGQGSPSQIAFWLRESRTPGMLLALVREHPETSRKVSPDRPLLQQISTAQVSDIEQYLLAEEQAEREKDKVYWQPLRKELERLRRRAVTGEQ